jgi:metallophosphoesterase superfamily enzyme
MAVEPLPGEPAAVADVGTERALVVADYHAGIEVSLRLEGVELQSRAEARREHLLSLLAATDVDRLVVLGDLVHSIGEPYDEEREEVTGLLDAVTKRVPMTLAKGNHDGDVEALLVDHPAVEVTPTAGARLDDLGVAHGHTWPGADVLEASIVCVGHEHPVVRLEDEVGGRRVERAWLRGPLDLAPFRAHRPEDADPLADADGELVVFPAFNDLSGGTWVNVAGQAFLAPFLPAALPEGDAYLLDGTRLGPYDAV